MANGMEPEDFFVYGVGSLGVLLVLLVFWVSWNWRKLERIRPGWGRQWYRVGSVRELGDEVATIRRINRQQVWLLGAALLVHTALITSGVLGGVRIVLALLIAFPIAAWQLVIHLTNASALDAKPPMREPGSSDPVGTGSPESL